MSLFLFLFLCSLLNVSNGGRSFNQLPEFFASESSNFNYGGSPQTQFSRYPQFCKTGRIQSPIDISPPFTPDPDAKLVVSKSFYVKREKEYLINSGHRPQFVDLPNDPKKFLTFKGKTYQYSNVHFYYGTNDHEGSNHALLGRKFPLEFQYDFFNVKYGSIKNARNYPDGLLGIGQFFQIGQANPIFGLLSNLKDIVYPNQTKIVPTGRSLADDVPLSAPFYYYSGSLSEPMCNEDSIYIISEQIGNIAADQMQMFRNVLRDYRGKLVVKNWRYLQPRNGRKIYYSSQPTHSQPQSSNSVADMASLSLDEVVEVMGG